MTGRAGGWSTRRRVRAAVRDATRAASVHNSQPWRFLVAPDRVELRGDGSARPRVIDPDGRWWIASIGAAAANLELGLRSRLGRRVHLLLAPSALGTDDPVVVATWDHEPRPVDPLSARLHGAITARRTTRGPLYGPVDPTDLADVVAAVATGPGPHVHAQLPDGSASAALLGLGHEADARWRDDPAYLAEIQLWAHRRDRRGVPPRAHGVEDIAHLLPGRDFSVDPSAPGGRRPHDYYEVSPVLLVLTTDGDGGADRLAGGIATQRAMLAATAAGLGVGVLGQLVEDAGTRSRAAAALGAPGTVQQVLRLGRPAADLGPARSPRLPLRRVITRGA